MSPVKQIRDAAIVLNSLPDETMQDVLAHLDEDSRRQLMDSMDALELVSGAEFHQASNRFRSLTTDQPQAAENSKSEADARKPKYRDWPRDSLGPPVVANSPGEKSFDFLIHLESDARKRLLEAEHPLNVAMVMTALSPAQASAITREMDPAFRVSVMRRLCHLDIVDDSKVMELRYGLRMRARRMLAIEHCTRKGLTVAADLLSLSDRQTQDGVIAWLSDRDEELGRALKKRVMSVQNLADFSEEEIKKLLKRVDTSAWAGALRSTVPSVAQRILKCMAPRAAYIVSAEMAAFNPLDEKAMQWSVEQVMNEAIKLRKEIPGAEKPRWR